jgi:GNAT superfamily N-acetyltransferase
LGVLYHLRKIELVYAHVGYSTAQQVSLDVWGKMRRAVPGDVPLLIHLMADFYVEAGYALNHARAAEAFASMIADERLGDVWIIETQRQPVGHLVLTLKFTMEYSGFVVCLDDLYVAPEWRSQGLGTQALMEVLTFCETAGIRSLTVEVGHDNGPAQTVYRRTGFTEAAARQLLALELAVPCCRICLQGEHHGMSTHRNKQQIEQSDRHLVSSKH